MADSIQSIIDELKVLSVDEIAAKLEGLGITGYISATAHCPLANYFKGIFPEKFFEVTEEIIACDSSDFDDPKSELHEYSIVNSSISDFVDAFDSWQYPTLVRVRERKEP